MKTTVAILTLAVAVALILLRPSPPAMSISSTSSEPAKMDKPAIAARTGSAAKPATVAELRATMPETLQDATDEVVAKFTPTVDEYALISRVQQIRVDAFASGMAVDELDSDPAIVAAVEDEWQKVRPAIGEERYQALRLSMRSDYRSALDLFEGDAGAAATLTAQAPGYRAEIEAAAPENRAAVQGRVVQRIVDQFGERARSTELANVIGVLVGLGAGEQVSNFLPVKAP